MDTAQRHGHYQAVRQEITPAQRRRLRQKAGSRKTHAHESGQRCVRCRPEPEPSAETALPWRE